MNKKNTFNDAAHALGLLVNKQNISISTNLTKKLFISQAMLWANCISKSDNNVSQ